MKTGRKVRAPQGRMVSNGNCLPLMADKESAAENRLPAFAGKGEKVR